MFRRNDAVWMVPEPDGSGVLFTGQGVRLRPRHRKVLDFLVKHKGRIVDDDMLSEHLWPDQDGGIDWGQSELNHIITDLRNLLPKSVVKIDSIFEPRNGRANGRRTGWRLTGEIGIREMKDDTPSAEG